jgi:hypothetical protein
LIVGLTDSNVLYSTYQAKENIMDPTEPSPEFSQEKGDAISKDPIENIKKLLKPGTTKQKTPKPYSVETKTNESGTGIWRVAALLSLAINILFLAFILWTGIRLFRFKTTTIEPLLKGVYDAVGQMGEVEVQTEVKVSSEIPVAFDIHLQRDTTVTLSEPTRITGAYLSIRSATLSIDAPSTIDLPIGAELPITMDLTIPVSTTIPVELTTPVELKLSESDLQPVTDAVQNLIEPYERLLDETPDCWQMLIWGGKCPE